MAAIASTAGRRRGLGEELFGVRTPGTLLLFFASSVLSLSLIFQGDPESIPVLSAHGWGHAPHFWEGELWRLWVNQLLHTRFWHFACNAWWFLIFSPVLEEILGTRRFLVQTALAAWIIGLAGNLSWEAGGVGLSGLLYFQFGYLVQLSASESAAARVCDRSTRILMWGGLLLLGPALTFFGLVQVGNVVHLAGCLTGLLAGYLHRRPLRRRLPAAVALPLLLAASWYLHAPALDPDWHFWRAYRSADPGERISHYRRVLELDPGDRRASYNLALAAFEAGDLAQAEALWLRCIALEPNDPQVCRALFSLYARRGDAAGMERWAGRLQRISSVL